MGVDGVHTMWSEGGVASLRHAPRAPLGTALSSGTHAELVVHVGVQVHHQELRLLADVRVLVLRGGVTPILQAVVLRAEVLIHLQRHLWLAVHLRQNCLHRVHIYRMGVLCSQILPEKW